MKKLLYAVMTLTLSTAAAATTTLAASAISEPVLQPDTMAARVAACTVCHGEQGRASADGYYPRLAGKPQDYLYHQLLNFRDGRRQYRPMEHLLQNLPDHYLHEIAGYFADQEVPYPAPQRPAVSAGMLEQGRVLVQDGDPARNLPACIACHGASLGGAEPAIPGLLGLADDYLVSQLGAWQHGLRHAAAPDCMADIVQVLNPDDIRAVAAWLAAQPVITPYAPEPAGSIKLPMECGSQTLLVASTDNDQQLQHGEYLARIGNCMGCHTSDKNLPYAGGSAIPTSFGTFYGPNITPDVETGIGAWNADDFWRALHNGKSRDGSLLYPAFPYTEYTHITRSDADALYTYLQTIDPVRQASPSHELTFPYNMRPVMAIWRAIYFRPGEHSETPEASDQWTRGRYLVDGLGHCIACHAPRNSLGATRARDGLSGGMILGQNWYAPPLNGDPITGLGNWSAQDIADLLQTGVSVHSTAAGLMAHVVSDSTQYLSSADALAMGVYLKTLPAPNSQPVEHSQPSSQRLEPGKKLYTQYCAQCHQASGEGSGSAWPTLVGNPTVLATPAVNAAQVVLNGGYAPATAANPQPHGMPPFAQILNDTEIAQVLSYIRNSWSNSAEMVTQAQVRRAREN